MKSIKNKMILKILAFLLALTLSFGASSADQFSFDVTEVEVIDNGNIFKGLKRGTITTDDGIIINADTFIFNKTNNVLNAKGNVKLENTIEKYSIFSQEVTYFKNDEKIFTKGKSKATDNKGQTIESDKFSFNNNTNILNAEGNVKVINKLENYEIFAEKITYFKNEEKILTEGKTSAEIHTRYKIDSKDVIFLKNQNKLISKNQTKINDQDDQMYILDEFVFLLNESILKGKNILTITDYKKPKSNKLFFSSSIIDLDNKSFVSKDTKIDLYKDIFDRSENDPRIAGVSSRSDGKKTILKKAVFTSCKKNDTCPPWSISAEEIEHDKEKKQITYNKAFLKILDVPVFYLPTFFHPDPTVQRQSGLLKPEINFSQNLGSSLSLPYYYKISEDKDYTIKPILFDNKYSSIQNEYRQTNNNYDFLADFGFVKGYKPNKGIKDKKNFGHLFAKLNYDLNFDGFNTSKLSLKIEKVNNDSYLSLFNSHVTKSKVKPADINILNNKLELVLNNNDYSFNTGIQSYETIGTRKSDRHQFVLPYYNYDKIVSWDIFDGLVSFKSSGNNTLNNTNILESNITNDINYSSNDFISNLGIKRNLNVYFKNFNSVGQNSSKYKSSPQVEVVSLYNLKLSYPLFKAEENRNSYLTPKLSLTFNPSDMKDHSSSSTKMNVGNMFNINRLGLNDSFEAGRSLTLGMDFKKEFKTDDINRYFEIKLATALRDKEENFIPSTSTLNKKNSNLFGSIKTDLFNNINFDYNFSLDNDLKTFEYNDFNTKISLNNLITTFGFLEENGEMGDANVFYNTIGYKIDDKNYITFKTRRNRKINLTEYYDLIYEYKNDCLTASVKYKKSYYSDANTKPEENLFFSITLFPLTTLEQKADNLINN